MRVQALFIDGDLAATLRAQRDKALRAVDEITESTFRSEDPSRVVAELYDQFRMEPVVLTEGAISVEAHDADIDPRRFRDIGRGFQAPHRRCERGLLTCRHRRTVAFPIETLDMHHGRATCRTQLLGASIRI